MNRAAVSTLVWIWSIDTRGIEILFGLFMIARSFVLWMVPHQMSSPTYDWFLNIGPSNTWALIFFLVGFSQIAAVIINGRWHRTPSIRMAALLMSFVAYSVLTTGFVTATAWLAVSVYATISAGSFWCLVNVAYKN